MENKYKLAIFGSKNFIDYKEFKLFILKKVNVNLFNTILTLQDKFFSEYVENFAKEFNIEYKEIPLQSDKLGKIAKIKKYEQIINEADMIFIFMDNDSKNALTLINMIKEKEKLYHVYK